MEIVIDASIDRQRVLWVATSTRFPEFVAEAATVDQLREKFAAALERAELPGDARLKVRFHYEHPSRGATLAMHMTPAKAEEHDPVP